MKNIFLLLCLLFFTGFLARSQVIPPGLGSTKMASWLAVGIQQDLDTAARGWSSSTYVGVARMSSPDTYHLLEKQGVFVLNQEFKHDFHEDWEYSLAFSYRRQNEYDDHPPFEKEDPGLKQEFRLYGRFSRIFKVSSVEITPTFRQEYQKYFTPDFEVHDEKTRLRSRFRIKVAFPLTADKKHKLSFYSEQLFSTSLQKESREWTPFAYKDSRFSLYYSLSPETIPWTINLGYMNNLVGRKNVSSGHYLGLDFIWKNPFSR